MRKLTALALTHKPDETPVAVADQNCLSSARYARPDASGRSCSLVLDYQLRKSS